MGRYSTLNPETKDLVNCLLPALAAQFKVKEVVDIIPEDIRMRAWDCEKRDHIKSETENDPRNWGVQFLKDLMAISRLKGGNLAEFQDDLRAKAAKHEPKHPWVRLADVKELKDHYEHPERQVVESQDEASSGEGSSTDSYLEELVEEEVPRGTKRPRRPRYHEAYQARVQQNPKRRKYGRLRRGEEGGYHRQGKSKRHNNGYDSTPARNTPVSSRAPIRRPSRVVDSSREGSPETALIPSRAFRNPSFRSSTSPGAFTRSSITHDVDTSDQPLEVQQLQAELELAEAELKTARLRIAYIKAKERAEQAAGAGDYEGAGTIEEPCTLK